MLFQPISYKAISGWERFLWFSGKSRILWIAVKRHDSKKGEKKIKTGRKILVVLLALAVAAAALLGIGLYRQVQDTAEQKQALEQAKALEEEYRQSGREMETKIGELEKQVEELTQELEKLQKENESLKEQAESTGAEGQISSSGEKTVFSRKDNGYVVVLDAGHQGNGADSEQEPVGPGASEMKARDSGGTQGVSGYPEYALNLEMALRLRTELENRGYTVILTRDSNDVRISNRERAAVANDNGADVFLRIHANGDEDSSVYGALSMATSLENPYVSPDLSQQSQNFAQTLIDGFCEATGAYNRGVMLTDSMSGLNWSQVPCAIIEMGFMSNPEEDAKMQTEEYQEQMTQGLANGIDWYLGVG